MPQYTNQHNLSLPLAVFLATDDYDGNEEGVISATSLIQPTRQIILSSRIKPEDVVTDISQLIASRLGTAIHDAIEKSWKGDYKKTMKLLGYPKAVIESVVVNPTGKVDEDNIPVYLEQRAYKKLGKHTISGKYDFVAEGIVQDFKTTSTFVYTSQCNKEKFILQGSIYRWLNPKIITEDYMIIHYIMKDWQSAKAVTKDYPPLPMVSERYLLKSIQETQRYIENKLKEIDKYWDSPEEDIPLCNDDDLWRKPTLYKYYKDPNKTERSTKNYDNLTDAYNHLHQDGNVGKVVEVKGQVSACKYCSAFALCRQKDKLIATGELVV